MNECQHKQVHVPNTTWGKVQYAIRRNAPAFLPLLFIGLLTSCVSIFGDTKKTDEYKCGIELVRKNEEVRKLLGEPIDDSSSASGAVSDDASGRSVVMIVPISGPKGSGQLKLTSVRDKSDWDLILSLEHNGENVAIFTGPYPCK